MVLLIPAGDFFCYADIHLQTRALVAYFKSRPSDNEKLKAAQVKTGRQPLKLVQEVETRRNSTTDMVQQCRGCMSFKIQLQLSQ